VEAGYPQPKKPSGHGLRLWAIGTDSEKPVPGLPDSPGRP
jgi:hypothetical protein